MITHSINKSNVAFSKIRQQCYVLKENCLLLVKLMTFEGIGIL
jgi:hypothetical protein